MEGFSLIYDRCVRLKEELLLALHGFEQVPVRRLLRQSAFYGKLLEGLYTPSALRSPEGERRITDRLYAYFQGHGAERLFPIADSEKASLLEGDIPYFYALGDGKDLMAEGKVVCRDFFRDHLCCGNSAAVEFLLEAGRRLERPELTAKARELLFSMRERAEKRGKYTLLPEGYAQTFDPSLFSGISGIGYELLRLAQPERIESLLV